MTVEVTKVPPDVAVICLLCHAEDVLLRYSTRYAVSGAPLVLAGAVHDTVAVVPVVETLTLRGAVGMPVRVDAVVTAETVPFPTLL